MSMTRLGQATVAAGIAAFLVALATASWLAALVGAGLLAFAFGPREPTAPIAAERRLPQVIEAGKPFEMTIEATAPGGCSMRIHDLVPRLARVHEREETVARGRTVLRMRLEVEKPSALVFGGTRILIQEPWGMREDTRHLALPTVRYVRPEPAAVDAGRKLGKRARFTPRAKRGFEREAIVERLRDFEPGDRLRDIDWAHTSKLQKLIAREQARSSTLPIVLLIEATPSMRWTRRKSKLATSVDACFGLLGAATARAHPIGLIAWSERGIEARHPVSTSRRVLPGMLRQLYELPPEETIAQPPAPAEDDAPELAEADRAFLDRSAAFTPGATGPRTPLAAALDLLPQVARQPSLVVIIMDVEERPLLAPTIARNLRRRGHFPIVAGIATGAHHYARTEVDAEVLDRLVLWRRNRRLAESSCRTENVPFTLLAPSDGVGPVLGVIGFDT